MNESEGNNWTGKRTNEVNRVIYSIELYKTLLKSDWIEWNNIY